MARVTTSQRGIPSAATSALHWSIVAGGTRTASGRYFEDF